VPDMPVLAAMRVVTICSILAILTPILPTRRAWPAVPRARAMRPKLSGHKPPSFNPGGIRAARRRPLCARVGPGHQSARKDYKRS
jgi:hypothetical protein